MNKKNSANKSSSSEKDIERSSSRRTGLKLITRKAQEWTKNTLEPVLVKHPEREEEFVTSSGVQLERCYFPRENLWDEEVHLRENGFPGEYPFTRGVQPTMYRGRHWTMRQYSGFATAEETNKRYRYLLSQGTTGLSVAFDLPTQMGRDSDHSLSRGEVGRVGVAVDTLSDMEILFDSIPLEKVSTSMTINATAPILLAFYLALAKKRNISWDKLRGTIQNDILKEYIARGTYIYPPEPALRLVTNVFEFCRDQVPNWNTISISGYHIREAGSNAAQELAFTLADGITYVEAALTAGLDIDDFAPRLAFFFNCHNEFLEEIAKFRAARRMWAKIMRERFRAKKDRSCTLRFHTQTAGSTLTANEPEVNVARTTLQALAAVLGGTQSLHTNAYDEALCLPTEASARLALRTQQVIAHESGVANTIDPLGGSYCIESLTDEVEAAAWDYLEKIESMGGMVRAIEVGYPQREIEESAYTYQREIDRKKRVIVGVNACTGNDGQEGGGGFSEREFEILRIDPAIEAQQVERLKQVKHARDKQAVDAALERLRKDAAEGVNVMPAICDAVGKEISLGEISDVFRERFGEYRAG